MSRKLILAKLTFHVIQNHHFLSCRLDLKQSLFFQLIMNLHQLFLNIYIVGLVFRIKNKSQKYLWLCSIKEETHKDRAKIIIQFWSKKRILIVSILCSLLKFSWTETGPKGISVCCVKSVKKENIQSFLGLLLAKSDRFGGTGSVTNMPTHILIFQKCCSFNQFYKSEEKHPPQYFTLKYSYLFIMRV